MKRVETRVFIPGMLVSEAVPLSSNLSVESGDRSVSLSAVSLVAEARHRQRVEDDLILSPEAMSKIELARKILFDCVQECFSKHPVWVWAFGRQSPPRGSIPHHVRFTAKPIKLSWSPEGVIQTNLKAKQGYAFVDVFVRSCDGMTIAEDLAELIHAYFLKGLTRQQDGLVINISISSPLIADAYLVCHEYCITSKLDWFVEN